MNNIFAPTVPNQKWWLYLDDERYPNHSFENFRIARSVDDAIFYIVKLGVPDYMSLDHDMGYNRQTGMDFCKRFCDMIRLGIATPPDDFWWEVHSANPDGAKNMISYLNSFFKAHAEGLS